MGDQRFQEIWIIPGRKGWRFGIPPLVSAGTLVDVGINRESPKEVGLVSVVFTCGNICEEQGLEGLSGIATAEVGLVLAALMDLLRSALGGEKAFAI